MTPKYVQHIHNRLLRIYKIPTIAVCNKNPVPHVECCTKYTMTAANDAIHTHRALKKMCLYH